MKLSALRHARGWLRRRLRGAGGLAATYDTRNPFARILRGELPRATLYETEHVLAFLDNAPRSPGHALIIAKASRARHLLDAEPEVLERVIEAVGVVSAGLVRALRPDGLEVQQFSGRAAGQSVFHLHFHVVPVWKGDGGFAAWDQDTLARAIAAAITDAESER